CVRSRPRAPKSSQLPGRRSVVETLGIRKLRGSTFVEDPGFRLETHPHDGRCCDRGDFHDRLCFLSAHGTSRRRRAQTTPALESDWTHRRRASCGICRACPTTCPSEKSCVWFARAPGCSQWAAASRLLQLRHFWCHLSYRAGHYWS